MTENETIFLNLLKQISFSGGYLVAETKHTIHYIERTTYKDRGKWKWIAESKASCFNNDDEDKERYRSHVDHQDLFPRLYFFEGSLAVEFFGWLASRQLEVTSLRLERI